MLDLLKKVSKGIYKPEASEKVQAALESPGGKEYTQFLMHGLLAQNYILNMKFKGKLSNKEFEELVKLAGTRDGVMQLSAHMVLSGVDAEKSFDGINMVSPEVVEDPDKLDPSIEKHLIEPEDPTKVESEHNPATIKKIN